MSQITGGTVEYERRVKTGDYEHKHLKVTLSFTSDEPNSNMDEIARSRAILLVEQGLQTKVTVGGLIVPEGKGNVVEQAKPEVVSSAKIEAANSAPPKKTLAKAKAPPLTEDVFVGGTVNGGETRTVKQQLEASLKATAPPARIIDTGEKVDPSAMRFPDDSRAASNADLITGTVPAAGIDRTATDPWDKPAIAAEITRDTMVKHINSATGNRGVNPEVIHKLINTYGVKTLSEVPQDKRVAFLAEVDKL